MKNSLFIIFIGFMLSGFTEKSKHREEVELVCIKRHSTSNTCHYNFKIGGANYRFMDVGCKGKKDVILKRANEGELGLAKDWKISCPEPKQKPVTGN